MSFTAFKSEGGLLPADMLDQIATGTREGQRPADFGLDKNRRLTDEIAAAWADARDLWKIYQRALSRLRESDTATTATRDQWMVPLLHLLGYDELTYTSTAVQVDQRTYAISHWVQGTFRGAPIHIVGSRLKLDIKERGRLSPHALVQEYLNRSEEHLWGLVSNGLRLRVLRTSAKLTRPTYLEIDLEQIMAGEKFAEFCLLYRLLHRTRFPAKGAGPTECFLEQYYQEVQKVGGRVREKLRNGVEAALRHLGNGFLAHSANQSLRERLLSSALSGGEFYRQLLRLIYRLLFLMVAEERQLVGPDSPDKWEVYIQYYSVTRLRNLSERFAMGAQRHADLWRQLRATFAMFRSEAEGEALEVSPLDGALFGPGMIPDLEDAELDNLHLIDAMRNLSLYEDGRVRRRVNYGALDVEELGSVYESLLEYKPRWAHAGDRWEFELVPGSDRRATGSYYTHPELVHELVVHALDPVIAERKRGGGTGKEQAQRLLTITVCDLACGSGHFLLAAARRIAAEVSQLLAGENQVLPEDYRKSLRDVIQHCIYGLDLNPLAVDLCKVALWLEGLNRGRPLSFLDHRIRRGNSLVGCTPAMLASGIPDVAYDAVVGDDKKVAAIYKKRNKEERHRQEAGQITFDYEHMKSAAGAMANTCADLDDQGEESTDQVHRKEDRFKAARGQGTEWHREWTACNLWTAAFFAPKALMGTAISTTDTVNWFLQGATVYGDEVVTEANRMADELGFFHWYLEFPEVMERGGFDCVLGNPPFLGGIKISSLLGAPLIRWLKANFTGTNVNTDLCAYFFRRAFEILRTGGNLGLIATNTIAQGDTRAGGLLALAAAGGSITFAVSSMKWPGDANLQVALVGLHKGAWAGDCLLDGRHVARITPLLDDGESGTGEPKRLAANAGVCFNGSKVLGLGFVLGPDEARRLLDQNSRNRDVVLPYLDGEDVNSRPDQSPRRWVINFWDWPLEQAEQYPECLAVVRERVKPERDVHQDTNCQKYWWRFGRLRPELQVAIAGMQRVLVTSMVTKHLCFSFVPTGWVYFHGTAVFALDGDEHLTMLQSGIHEVWARRYASTLETRLRYTPSDVFETFPLPALDASRTELLRGVGGAYYHLRQATMLDRQLGLTKLYNLFHNPDCLDTDIDRLRRLHIEMDQAVLAAYGWSDIHLSHNFFGEGAEARFGIEPEAKKEVLRRLLDLNHRRVAEEKGQCVQPTTQIVARPLDEEVGMSRRGSAPEPPKLPDVVPALSSEYAAFIRVISLLHASGGKIPRMDLARAFALQSRPEVLLKLAPPSLMSSAQQWASKVGHRTVVPGLLVLVLRDLAARRVIALTTDNSLRSTVTATEYTPSENEISPWFNYEAWLALKVLASLPQQQVRDVDETISGDDRRLLTTEAI